ncbi:hypothetical protein FACS1894189_8760 [Planctomycetales bacterium]|nr:hypothetical protein FACS1894189_8760 [Planctomycetales bacterium]
MTTLQATVSNPKAVKLLQDFADIKLVAIEKQKPARTQLKAEQFKNFVTEVRGRETIPISLEEITAEVEAVREERYAQMKK